MKKIFSLLIILVFIFSIATYSLQNALKHDDFQPEGNEDFTFVVMGDNRPWWKGEDVITQNEHFLGNITRANSSGSDFVVIVGDLIHGYTNDSILIHQQWDSYDKACKMFDMPYVSVVGNHDVWDEQSQNIWLNRYGPQYFSWDHRGCHFIVLSSEIVGETKKITGEQLNWLKNDLKGAASSRCTFLFLHQPLWAYKSEEESNENQWNSDVHPLLAEYGVNTVFAGHWHIYSLYPTRDNVRYVITGGAGAEIGPYELAGCFFHFVKVDVVGNSSTMNIITIDRELPSDYVTPYSVWKLRKSIIIEPPTNLPKAGSIKAQVTVLNPIDDSVKARVVCDLQNSSWVVEQTEVIIPPNSQKDLIINANYKDIFPLPRSVKIELIDDQRLLFGWELFKNREKIYDIIVESNPNAPWSYANRGEFLRNHGKIKEAINDFDRAIEINPNFEKAYIWRSYAKSSLGKHEEALKDCKKAIQLNPFNQWYYANRSEINRMLGKYENAMKDIDKAIKIDPNEVKFYEIRAKIKKEIYK